MEVEYLRALIIEGPGQISWHDIPQPVIQEDEVLIKVKAVGICGTDVHILHGKHGAVTYPRIPGHELVGEIIEIGSAVTGINLGDHVAVDPVLSCGQCPMCKKGRNNICHQVKCLGVQAEGGFTQLIKSKANLVYPFDPSIPWDIAALVEPFSIGAQIAERMRISSDDKVLIIGGGTIGLALLQIVQGVYGAQAVVADISPYKLELARDMQAYQTIDSTQGDVISQASQIWNNYGPTVIVEAVGNSSLLEYLIKGAPPGCRIGVIGFMAEPISISPVDITKRELEIIGSRLNKNKFPDVLKWFKEGKVSGEKMITHRFNFTDAEEAFRTIDKEPAKVCKVILEF